jgi:hypothetical protein
MGFLVSSEAALYDRAGVRMISSPIFPSATRVSMGATTPFSCKDRFPSSKSGKI